MNRLSTLREQLKDQQEIKPKYDRWQDELKALKLASLKKKYPSAYEASGGDDQLVKPYTDKTSNGLTKAVLDFLNLSGHYATRINTTGTMRKIRGEMKWTKGSTRKGTSDIHAVIKGTFCSIEVKINKDTQSDNQTKEEKRVTTAGGLYLVAKNYPQFREWFKYYFE